MAKSLVDVLKNSILWFLFEQQLAPARNVSPEHPISSMSSLLVDLSMEKFLQLVPATKRLEGGSGTGRP